MSSRILFARFPGERDKAAFQTSGAYCGLLILPRASPGKPSHHQGPGSPLRPIAPLVLQGPCPAGAMPMTSPRLGCPAHGQPCDAPCTAMPVRDARSGLQCALGALLAAEAPTTNPRCALLIPHITCPALASAGPRLGRPAHAQPCDAPCTAMPVRDTHELVCSVPINAPRATWAPTSNPFRSLPLRDFCSDTRPGGYAHCVDIRPSPCYNVGAALRRWLMESARRERFRTPWVGTERGAGVRTMKRFRSVRASGQHVEWYTLGEE